MPPSSPRSSGPARVDARRNRRRLLEAATALVLEAGGAPTRDAVARRAGVGIATLYRHFPAQQDLLRDVAVDVLDRTLAEGRQLLEHAGSGADALRGYLHAAVDAGLGVVGILHPLLDDADWPEQRRAAEDLLGRLVEVAHREGAIAGDVDAADLALVAIRFCRPLGIGLDPDAERALAHRQLDHHLDGLLAPAT